MASTTQEALIAEMLGDVGKLHDLIQVLPDEIRKSIESTTSEIESAGTRVVESIQSQTAYINEVMLKDREKFVIEQERLLQSLKEWIDNRDKTMEAILLRITTKSQERVEQATTAATNQITSDRSQQKKYWEERIQRTLYIGLIGGIIGLISGATAVTIAVIIASNH